MMEEKFQIAGKKTHEDWGKDQFGYNKIKPVLVDRSGKGLAKGRSVASWSSDSFCLGWKTELGSTYSVKFPFTDKYIQLENHSPPHP
jgi:hypothetical protein